MRKAVIENNKVVNILEFTENSSVGFRLPLDQTLYDCGQYPVQIGDDFKDGVYSRDGQPLTPVPTDAQKIADLEAQLNALLGVEGV